MKKIVLALSLVVAGVATATPSDPSSSSSLSPGPSWLSPSSPSAEGSPRARRLAQKGDGKGGEGKLGEGKRGELRERVRQKVQTYVTVELASRANLDEKKSLQLGSAIKAHMERKQQARQKKRGEMEKLRALVDSKGNDAALKAQMKTLVDAARDEDQVQLLLDDTAKFLTPTEQARVVLALPGVMKDTMKMVKEARGGGLGGGGRRGGRGGGGGGFDDHDGSDD